jgi:hypothetical protein
MVFIDEKSLAELAAARDCAMMEDVSFTNSLEVFEIVAIFAA